MHAWQWVQRTYPTLLIFHVANERKGSIGTAMHFKRLGVRPGVADFLAFTRHAPPIAIELKDDKGVQSKEQEHFQKQWEDTGGKYIIVRTLAEFQGCVQALLLFC